MADNELEIDDVTPTDRALMLEKRDELIYINGGIATKIQFNSVTITNLNDFLTNDVPLLKEQQNDLTVIRDSLSNRHYVLYGDQVIRYNDCSLSDVGFNTVSKFFETNADFKFCPGLEYPLISWIEKKETGMKNIIVKLDNFSFEFRDSRLGVNERLYMPPLWFKVTMTNAMSVTAIYIAIARENNPDVTQIPLLKLPLPNIYGDGRVCLGSSQVSVGFTETPTPGQLISNCINRIFNSGWNTDLIDYDLSGVLGGAQYPLYQALEASAPDVKKKFDGYIHDHSDSKDICEQYRVLAVLSRPNGWVSCNFKQIKDRTTKGFIDLM